MQKNLNSHHYNFSKSVHTSLNTRGRCVKNRVKKRNKVVSYLRRNILLILLIYLALLRRSKKEWWKHIKSNVATTTNKKLIKKQ